VKVQELRVTGSFGQRLERWGIGSHRGKVMIPNPLGDALRSLDTGYDSLAREFFF